MRKPKVNSEGIWIPISRIELGVPMSRFEINPCLRNWTMAIGFLGYYPSLALACFLTTFAPKTLSYMLWQTT